MPRRLGNVRNTQHTVRKRVLKNPKISPFFLFLTLILVSIIPIHASPTTSIIVTTDKQTYESGEAVTAYGNLTKDGIPVTDGLVGIEVRDQKDNLVTIRTVTTGTEPSITPYVEVLSVIPCNETGGLQESFKKGNINIYFKVTGVNHDIEWRTALITVRAHTPDNIPYSGWSVADFPLAPRPSPHDPPQPFAVGPISMPIDMSVPTGNWTVYANAYTDWPREQIEPGIHGTPYCMEVSASFLITNGEPPPPPAPPTNQTNGNYNLTFQLSRTANEGTYAIYTTSRYYGVETFNSTTFEVIPWYMKADFDADGDIDEDDLWHFCGAFIEYWKTGVKDPLCDFDADGDIDEDDLWTFCEAFIEYYKTH